MIGGLVLAAGAGERFGGRKQLAPLGGRPLLEHVLAAMSAAPVDRVVVVLGAYSGEVLDEVDLHGASAVVCSDWQEGVGASLRVGVAALAGDCDAIVVALGDQPLLSPEAVGRVVDARDGAAAALRATYGGVAGHPVLFERSLFPELLALRGDLGARELLASKSVREVACDGLGAPDDVDTRDALRRLRAPL